jgi:hypothetical protein
MCGGVCGPSVEDETYSRPVRRSCNNSLKYGVKRTCKKCGQIHPNNTRCPKCGYKIYVYPGYKEN